jgi:heme-degrading monooxygenase HmoA
MATRAQPVTLITAFEVPPESDESFIAGWERARDFLATRDVFRVTALHRALRRDADFRFVNLARVDSAQAWSDAISDPAFPRGQMRFKAHPSMYEVVHEDGSLDEPGGTALISPFEVDADEDDRFLAAWEPARAVLAEQPGYLGTRLHRALAAADFRFVNVARWSSPLAFSKAVGRPEFQRAAAEMPFPSHPALYQIIRD